MRVIPSEAHLETPLYCCAFGSSAMLAQVQAARLAAKLRQRTAGLAAGLWLCAAEPSAPAWLQLCAEVAAPRPVQTVCRAQPDQI